MTEQQLARMAKRRLAILRHAEEITGNVALTCRYYGISRQGTVALSDHPVRLPPLRRSKTTDYGHGRVVRPFLGALP